MGNETAFDLNSIKKLAMYMKVFLCKSKFFSLCRDVGKYCRPEFINFSVVSFFCLVLRVKQYCDK